MSVVSKLQIVLEATTTAFDRGLRSATHTLQGFGRQVGQMHDRMDRFARHHNDALNSLKTAGQVATIGLGAIAFAIKGAVGEAMRFEDAMAEVKKVIDFDTPDGVTEFRNELEKLSGQLPIAFDGLAKIAAAAGQSGIATQDILRFTEAAAKMGTAFDVSAEEAGQAMAEMRVAFKMSQSEVETLADKINYLGNTTPNTAAKIMEVVQRIGSLGGIAGVSSDQIAALAGSITAVEPEVAATGIKNMMLALTKGESATKGQREAFEKLGLSATKVAKTMQKDSMGTLFQVIEAIKKLPKEAQVAMTNSIFGAEALPVISQFIENTDSLKTNLQAVGDSSKYAGSMNKEYEARAATLSNTLAILKNKITNIKAAIGEAFTPYIVDFADKFAPIMDNINQWVKANPELIATIAAVTAGVLALIAGLGGLALAFTAVTGGLGAIISIGSMVGAMFAGITSAISAVGMVGGTLAALGFPVAAVVAGIAAIVAGGVLLYQNWDLVKSKATELWQNLPKMITQAWQAIRSTWSALGTWFGGIWDSVKAAISAKIGEIKQVFNSWLGGMPAPVQAMVGNIISVWQSFSVQLVRIWNSLKDAAKSAWDGVVAVTKPIVSTLVGVWQLQLTTIKTATGIAFVAIKAVITAAIQTIKATLMAGLAVFASVFNAGFLSVKNIVVTAFNAIKALVRGDMAGVVNAISVGLTNAVSIIRSMVSNITGAFKTLSGQLMQAGRDAVQGFINGIKGKMSEALATARQMASQVVSTVKSALDIHSPSRVMKKLGKHTADGFAEGIRKNAKKAVKAAQKMAEDARKAVADEVANLKREIFLLPDNTPMRAVRYDIQHGKYGNNNTSELEHLTYQKYEMEQTKSVLDEILSIRKDMVFTHLTLSEQLEWEIKNTSKYNGVNAQALHALRLQTHEKQKFLALQEQSSKIDQANSQSRQNYLELEKRIALFGNQSKLAEFDYDWQNGAFSGADNMFVLRERSAIAKLEHLQHQANTKNAFDDMTKSMAGELSPLAKLQKELDDRLKIIKDYEDSHTNVELQAQQARQQAEQVYLAAKTNLMLDGYQNVFHGISGMTKSFFGEQSGIYRAMFAMEKGFAIAKAIIALKANIAEASKVGFPKNIPIIAGAVSQGMGIINDIRSIAMPVGQAHDGIMSVPKSGTWNLEKGERVLPRHTAQNLDHTLANLQDKRQGETKIIINNYSGEKTDVQQMPNGDMMVTIGKMIDAKVDAKVNQRFLQARRQGGELYGR